MSGDAAAGRSGLFRALRSPHYRVWIVGALVSNVGTWVQRTGQDWLVLTELTRHDAAALGLVTALQFGPQVLLLPWTGLAADRFDQRRLLVATQAAMGGLALVLGGLTLAGRVQLWQVHAFAFLFGCAAAFDGPVRQTFVARLVGDANLSNGVALNAAVFNAARLVGPALGGLVIASFGTGWAFVLNGVSFLGVLASLAWMPSAPARPAERTAGQWSAGLRHVRSRPDLLTILAMLGLIGAFGLNVPLYIATMAVGVFHTDARGYGLLSTVMAVGTLGGALAAAGRARPRFATLRAAALVFGLGCGLAALAPGYWLFAAALVVMGASVLTFTNTASSLTQLSVAPHLRGRIVALRIGTVLGATALGAPIAGWVAHDLGPRWALGLGAAAGVTAALIGFLAKPERPRTSIAVPQRAGSGVPPPPSPRRPQAE